MRQLKAAFAGVMPGRPAEGHSAETGVPNSHPLQEDNPVGIGATLTIGDVIDVG